MAKCKDCEYYLENSLCEYNECYTRPEFKICDAYTGKEKQEEDSK